MTEERGKSMSEIKDGRKPSGFSLVEVMTALVITMIIAGSIYGLLTGGQKAFRREPERTELQQNVRSAMDIVMRDVSNAGGGPGCDSLANVCDGITENVAPALQVFTTGLDGQGPATPGGGNSDVLQMLYADPSCKPIPIDLTSTSPARRCRPVSPRARRPSSSSTRANTEDVLGSGGTGSRPPPQCGLRYQSAGGRELGRRRAPPRPP